MIDKIKKELSEFKQHVTPENYERNIRIEHELISKNAKKTIPKRPTNDGQEFKNKITPAKRHTAFIPATKQICEKAKPIDKFSEEDQIRIWKQISDENSHYDVENNRFQIISMSPDDLPMSTVEQEIYSQGTWKDDIIGEIAVVNDIEKKIKSNGFSSQYPLMITYDEVPNPVLWITGGNHRLQAVRNLRSKNVLPNDVEVPVIVNCPKLEKGDKNG